MDDTRLVRDMICATITSDEFLQGLRHIWREELVGPAWRWVGNSCLVYLDQYGRAPGRDIEALWETETTLEPDVKESIGEILGSISDEWDGGQANVAFLLSGAVDYINQQLLLYTSAEIEQWAESGKVAKALEVVSSVKPVGFTEITAFDPSTRPDLIETALSDTPRSMLDLGGPYQEMVGESITRDSFVAFLGGEKVGKSWVLQGLSFALERSGACVLYCQCGDLSEGQQVLRFAVQVTGRNHRDQYNQALLSPIPDCELNQDGSCERKENDGRTEVLVMDGGLRPYSDAKSHVPCSGCPRFRSSTWWEEVPPCNTITPQDALSSWTRHRSSVGDRLRMQWWPSGSATVSGIGQLLQALKDRQGWPPPGRPLAVIVDYMDILAPEPNSGHEFRHREDAKWRAARRLSQDWGCAFITATQATRAGGSRRVLRPTDTSEDKRKAAHVTDMFGLNLNRQDRQMGWIRVNHLYSRDRDYDIERQVAVLRLLQRGRPNLGSMWFNGKRGENGK